MPTPRLSFFLFFLGLLLCLFLLSPSLAEEDATASENKKTLWEMVHQGTQGFSHYERDFVEPIPAHRYSHSAQTIGHYMVITHGYFYNRVLHRADWLGDTWKFDYNTEKWSEVEIQGQSTKWSERGERPDAS